MNSFLTPSQPLQTNSILRGSANKESRINTNHYGQEQLKLARENVRSSLNMGFTTPTKLSRNTLDGNLAQINEETPSSCRASSMRKRFDNLEV